MDQDEFLPPPGWRSATGDTSDLIQKTDWSETPLGPTEAWSASLHLAVGIVMASAFPMALRWGPQFTLIYNDAYRPILGDKHPWAFGRPAREAWAEVWNQILPVHEAILLGKTPSIFADDMLLRIQRFGSTWEDARFTLGYSPIQDPTTPTGIGGVLVTAVETTDRVSAEAALRASEERYELALNTAGAIGTWDWDITNNKVVSNAKFAELYSVDPARAAVGEPIESFVAGVHPEDRDVLTQEIRRSMEARDRFSAEYRLLQNDGTILWVFARGGPHFDETGNVVRLAGATVDISDRKATEDALSESQSFLSDILRSSGEAFYALDRDGSTLMCNQAFLKMLGFASEADVIGRKLHDIIHHTHPDGSHYDKVDCPIYVCADVGTPAHVMDELFFNLNGEAIPVEYWVNPIYRGGQHQGAICTFIDITERRAAEADLAKSEAEFRTFAQAMPNHVWASPPDGQLNWFNQRVLCL